MLQSKSTLLPKVEILTLPRALVNIEACDWGLKVSSVGQTIGAQGSKLWELVVGTVNLLDVLVIVMSEFSSTS